MTFSIEQALAEYFDNSGGGGIAYGGTGQSGTITGNTTGGSGTGSSYPTTGPAEVGPNGSQVVYGTTYFDENGEKIYIDIAIYAPEHTAQPQDYDSLFHTMNDMFADIHSFIYGEYGAGLAYYCSHDVYHDAGRHLRSLDELYQGSGTAAGGETSATAPKTTALLGLDGDDYLVGGDVVYGGAGHDTIVGGANGGALFGGIGNDFVRGGAGSDVLNGGTGNDWLDGGAGADLMDGGAGWDMVSYLSSATGVVIDLTTNQNGGAAAGDRIFDVEVVQGTNANDTLTSIDRGGGNGAELHGEGGDDGLIGKAGGDRLYGGAGNDWLDGGPGGDLMDGGEGWDVVSYMSASTGVVIDMTTNQNGGAAWGDTIRNVEVVQGTNAADDMTGVDRGGGSGVQLYGEGGNDRLTGAAGGDWLFGGSGNDSLDGRWGSDVLVGGAGADQFRFSTAPGAGNVDRIQDFSLAEGDRIVLDRSVFSGLMLGTLSSAAFATGSVATTAGQHVLYNASTGALCYDADGAGGAAAIQFATLNPGTALSASCFYIV